MPIYKVNTKVDITWYVRAEDHAYAWDKGEFLGLRSVDEYGFDRFDGDVVELQPGDDGYYEVSEED